MRLLDLFCGAGGVMVMVVAGAVIAIALGALIYGLCQTLADDFEDAESLARHDGARSALRKVVESDP